MLQTLLDYQFQLPLFPNDTTTIPYFSWFGRKKYVGETREYIYLWDTVKCYRPNSRYPFYPLYFCLPIREKEQEENRYLIGYVRFQEEKLFLYNHRDFWYVDTLQERNVLIDFEKGKLSDEVNALFRFLVPPLMCMNIYQTQEDKVYEWQNVKNEKITISKKKGVLKITEMVNGKLQDFEPR